MAKQLKQWDGGRLQLFVLYDRASRYDSPKVRAAKSKASSEAQKRINQKNALRIVEMRLGKNFPTAGSGRVYTLTYDDAHLPRTRKEAELRLKYFRQRLTAWRVMTGQDMVMIWCTEHKHGDGRWHHHAVINSTGEDYEAIRQLWIYGSDVDIKPLRVDKEKDYATLARYMCKEEGDRLGQRRWSYTRNASKPEVETFRVEDDTTVQLPKGARELQIFGDRNAYGSCRVIKYLAPGWDRARRPRARRRGSRRKKR